MNWWTISSEYAQKYRNGSGAFMVFQPPTSTFLPPPSMVFFFFFFAAWYVTFTPAHSLPSQVWWTEKTLREDRNGALLCFPFPRPTNFFSPFLSLLLPVLGGVRELREMQRRLLTFKGGT